MAPYSATVVLQGVALVVSKRSYRFLQLVHVSYDPYRIDHQNLFGRANPLAAIQQCRSRYSQHIVWSDHYGHHRGDHHCIAKMPDLNLGRSRPL